MLLELIQLNDKLSNYDVINHIPSDVSCDQMFLDPSQTRSQSILDQIGDWTSTNKMSLNPTKSNYMVFSRSKEVFTTRLVLDKQPIKREHSNKICGVWLTENMSWGKHCDEISKKAYSRMQFLSKLKYVGVSTEDLIDVYCKFIRSIVEYCSVVFHGALTDTQSKQLENIQTTAMRILLQENFVSPSAAREMMGLQELFEREKVEWRRSHASV